jgi:hypothetical protein
MISVRLWRRISGNNPRTTSSGKVLLQMLVERSEPLARERRWRER